MKYRTIVADPPWPVEWHGGGRGYRRTGLGYATMTIESIAALPVATLASSDSALFLWVTAALNRQGVGVKVAESWGFEVVGEFIWDKGVRLIGGKLPRICHEIVLVGVRGQHQFTVRGLVPSVQRWKVSTTNSRKPEAFIDLVEQVSPPPYVELFARRHRLGWDVWGDESANTAVMAPLA